MKIIRECPLLVGIVTVTAAISITSAVLMGTTYKDYSDTVMSGKAPLLSMFFRGASDGVFPWSGAGHFPYELAEDDWKGVNGKENNGAGNNVTDNNGAGNNVAGNNVTANNVTGNNSTDILAQTAGTNAAEADVPEEASDMKASAFLKKQNVGIFQEPEDELKEEVQAQADSAQENTADSQEDIVYEFTEVDDDYFCDALFIGDSRTVGLSEYCEALDERATFYSKISLTIFDVMDKKFIKTDDGKISIEEALSKEQYGKIYMMLGLNEIGTGNTEYFKNAYAEVLGRIRELQPDAIIYIQGIMHVSGKKSDSEKYFNNDYINERNAAIAELADSKDVFYIDMNEAVDDEDGNLMEELSFDEVHLKASAYERWHEFLLHNAIVR